MFFWIFSKKFVAAISQNPKKTSLMEFDRDLWTVDWSVNCSLKFELNSISNSDNFLNLLEMRLSLQRIYNGFLFLLQHTIFINRLVHKHWPSGYYGRY